MVVRASSKFVNQFSLRHSSRKRPLKLSTKALSVGLPGLMKCSFTLAACAQASSALLVNSGPLSMTMRSGSLRCAASRSSTRTTRSPPK